MLLRVPNRLQTNPNQSILPPVPDHSVPDIEKSGYYKGVSPYYPFLLYRTGREKYPYHGPMGPWERYSHKSIQGVYGTRLNEVWGTVGPLIRLIIRRNEIRYSSIDVARFITHDHDDGRFPGPVVIWIGVYPDSTTATTAHEVSKEILTLLKEHQIEDVEVEWRESVVRDTKGSALLPTVSSWDPTASVRGPLTTALGIPIATAERPNVEGNLGFFFREGRDRNGDVSNRILAVTCHHVLFEKAQLDYARDTPMMPARDVRLLSLSRFQKLLDDIKTEIRHRSFEIDRRKYVLKSEKNRHPRAEGEDEDELERSDEILTSEGKAAAELERFYADTLRDWGDSANRNIGTIDYCPPISSDVKGLVEDGIDKDVGFTEDWGTFKTHEDRWKDAFQGNFLDLSVSRFDFS